MNYIDEIATGIAGRCDMDMSDNEQRGLLRLFALLVLAKGPAVTLRDVHDAWAAWCADAAPEHRSLVPYEDLSPATRALDEPYCEAIRDQWFARERDLENTRPEHMTRYRVVADICHTFDVAGWRLISQFARGYQLPGSGPTAAEKFRDAVQSAAAVLLVAIGGDW